MILRDQGDDLEKAGIGMIQTDEPAFREGLPLKQKNWNVCLENAVHAFNPDFPLGASSTLFECWRRIFGHFFVLR